MRPVCLVLPEPGACPAAILRIVAVRFCRTADP
jgi:hypothetical protein